MTLRDELQEMVESLPEGAESVVIDASWLQRELDREASENGNGAQPSFERYLTTQEAAKRLSLKSETVAKWCRSGRFPNAFKTDSAGDSGEWRIPVGDLRSLKESRSGEKDRMHFDRK